jgi:hypothetical protein
VGFVVVHVAAAEARAADGDLHFGWGWGADGAGFLGAFVSGVVEGVESGRTIRRSFGPWRTEAWIWIDSLLIFAVGWSS